MFKFYRDYYWDKGRPKGVNSVDILLSPPNCYRIVVDPYFKRYTIEFYKHGKFNEIIYDSAFFDFRKLKPVEQNAWKKEFGRENEDGIIFFIKDQDDRIILMEKYQFQEGLCTDCTTCYPNGEVLAKQKITYKKLGHESNKTTLFDRLNKPVTIKEYESDEMNGEFTLLIKEIWSFKP